MRKESAPKCNQCGRSCAARHATSEGGFDDYGTAISVSGSYASPILPDMSTYHFTLCEPCIVKLMANLLHPPQIKCRWPGEEYTFPAPEELEALSERHWRQLNEPLEPQPPKAS